MTPEQLFSIVNLVAMVGWLPLVFFPGAGSELYRGLGSVVVGGLTVSTVFTLFVVPTLFSLVLDARSRFQFTRQRQMQSEPQEIVVD